MGSGAFEARLSFRAALFATAAFALSPQGASAQTATPDTSPSSSAEQQADSTVAQSEDPTDIVVTAQRREERLQDVPLSIAVVTGKELRDKDIRDITRLEQVVPGLRIGRSGAAARPAIRGVYTEAIQATSDPRIGFYIDEIYQSRLQQTTAAFVDLERVEVQKGPQGTLFGRNSLAGNIALTSARPRDQVDAGAAAIYGSFNRVKLEGFVNVPITEGVAFRVAGALDRHDAIYKSTVTKAADVGDLDYQFVRASLRVAPPGFDDRLEVLVRGSYFHQDDRGLGSFNAKNIGAVVDPSLIRQPGQSVTFSGATFPFPDGYNGGNYATGVLVPFSPVFRDGIPDINGADIGIPIGGKYDVLFDFTNPLNKVKAKNASAIINFDVTDNIRLRSLTGYTDFSYENRADGDGGPINIREFYFITTAKTLTQELQLQSSNPASPLQYTVGAFYMDDKIGEGSGSVFSTSNYSTVTAAAAGLPVLFADGGNCGYTFLPRVPNCNLNNAVSNDSATPVRARTKSYAAYGQASYNFADRLTLTAGARYTVDDKEYRQAAQAGGAFTTSVAAFVAARNAAALAAGQPAPFPSAAGYRAILPYSPDRADANFQCGGLTAANFGVAGTNVVVGSIPNYFITRCGERKFKYWTYRVAADYKITPDNMIYASFSTGVHSGGFGAAFTPTDIPQGTFSTFDAERSRAFEIGTKNSFFDRKLQVNASIFYNEYLDNQVQGTQFVSTGPNTNVSISTIANVGDTKAPGAEINFIARPVRGLSVRGALNYLRARNTVAPLGIFTSGLCSISTGSGPCVTNPVEARAGLGSGFFPNPFTNPELFSPIRNSAGTIVGYDSLFFGRKTRVQNAPDWSGSLGASYEIALPGGATVTPEADLLYSDEYLLSASTPNVTQEAYAKVDARVTFRTADDNISVQAFVQNLTNKATLGRITTGTLSAQGTYSDPRTYGVRVGYRF
jgi:iron complex outermembrane receptor protein